MFPTQRPDRRTGLLPRLRRTILRHRRLIAAALLCAAAGTCVEAFLPRGEPLTPVVAAASDLAIGTVLSAGDLDLAALPRAAVPPGASGRPAELVGRQLAAPLRRGDILTDTRLVGPGLLTGTAPGTVAVPLRPADPSTVRLVAAGQRVDVVVSTGNGYETAAEAKVIARDLAVLWAPPSGKDSSSPWPGAPAESGLVVVAASPGDAAALAGSSSAGDVHLVLTAGP
ncbi:RcpC/CpaB family pilus assembly protein [Arthrobacter sp. TMN-37]